MQWEYLTTYMACNSMQSLCKGLQGDLAVCRGDTTTQLPMATVETAILPLTGIEVRGN